MSFAIRPYHPSDLYSLYRICLLTGDGGTDASALYRDHELLGHFYAAPYAVLEPDLAFVLTNEGQPCGYILGTRDSAAFAQQCERDWFPVLRTRYALLDPADESPDAFVIRRIYEGRPAPRDLDDYPAHLHIDLLPVAQRKGWGRQLMQTFLERLRIIGVRGVHLGVAAKNENAIAFYERMGFTRIQANEYRIVYGMRLGG